MKIEIELEEIEKLRKESADLMYKVDKYKKQLVECGEDELRKHSVEVAEEMFNQTMQAVFKKLGFTQGFGSKMVFFSDLNHYYGKDWMQHKDLKIELGATITKEFKRAFIQLGITLK